MLPNTSLESSNNNNNYIEEEEEEVEENVNIRISSDSTYHTTTTFIKKNNNNNNKKKKKKKFEPKIISLSGGSSADEHETTDDASIEEDSDDGEESSSDNNIYEADELALSKQQQQSQQLSNYEDVLLMIDSAKDLLSQKRIMIKMLLTEHVLNNSQQVDPNRLVSFVKHVMSKELEGLSTTIVESKTFKDMFIDHYYRIFKQSLPADDMLSPSTLLSLYNNTINNNYLIQDNNIYKNSLLMRYSREFIEICKLGSGGFGSVYMARNLLDNQLYAVKKVNFSLHLSSSVSKVLREVKALARLDHKNILRYYHAWIELNTNTESNTNYSSVEGSLETNATSSFTEDQSYSLSPSSFTSNNTYSFNINNNNYNSFTDKDDDDEEEDESDLNSNSSSESNSSESEDESISSISNNNNNNSKSPKGQLVPYNPKLNISHMNLPTTNNQNPIPITHNTRIRYTLYVQTQFCEGKTLRDWLDNLPYQRQQQQPNNILPTPFSIFKQILNGLQYIHSMGLVHRDIKPANIFLTKEFNVKIGDFGLVKSMNAHKDGKSSLSTSIDGIPSKTMEQSLDSLVISNSLVGINNTHGIGTLTYASPEQLEGAVYSNKVDIYSLGIILFELLNPFNTQFERSETIKNLKKGIVSDEFKNNYKLESELILKMLSINPLERPKTDDIIKNYLPFILKSSSPSTSFNPMLSSSERIENYKSMDQSKLIELLIERDQTIEQLIKRIQQNEDQVEIN